LYDEFLVQCFGTAASDIKRMYDRWSRNYQGQMDVALSLHDLEKASLKVKDAVIEERIAELKAYVHYLRLYYDYVHKPSIQGYTELIDYIYSIHHLRLLQTYAMQTRYIKAPSGYKKASDMKAIAVENEKVKKLRIQLIENNFKKDLEENPTSYSVSKFIFDVKKAYLFSEEEIAKKNPRFINGRNSYRFYIAIPQKLLIKAGATKDTRLIIKDDQDKIILEKVISGSKSDYEAIEVGLSKGGHTLIFGEYYRFSRIIFPGNISFFSTTHFYDNGTFPLLYIYVPKDVSEIVYLDGYGPGTNKRGDWIDPDGKHIKPELLKYSTYRVAVPPQQRGKVWILNIGHKGFKLLNIPHIYSLNNFEYRE